MPPGWAVLGIVMPLAAFHPAVASWFESRFETPTEPQERAWPSIAAGRNTLIAAPTGSGKTLAAFLAAIDQLVRTALAGGLEDETRVVYVSPLKALSNDVQRNLEEPLAGIRRELLARGLPDAPIRTLVRTGDTPAAARTAMARKPPHILVTTPESLFILLTSESGRRMLSTARTVIVDEIHAVAGSKRGSHLALSLARLDALCGRRLVRIGLSATQSPIEEVARLLVGAPGAEGDCEIVDAGHRRQLDLGIEVPSSPLEAVMPGEVWQEVYDRLAELIRAHRTTLVFVNTRRLAERATRHLAERLGEERVASHHGSLAREQRLASEQRLKSGQLSALVATSSLELGIDIGSVDLVCQLASTRSISTFLQRVGRAGHRLAAVPKGRIFPTSRDELVETAALFDAVRRGELDRLLIPPAPLDILAQHVVAAVAAEEWSEDELFALVRRAWPYRALERREFDEVVAMLAAGFTTRRGRRGAWVHQDAVAGRLRARKGARLVAMTSGGAIPDTADYQVVLLPANTVLGSVHEDFAVESMAGDVFQLGNASWRVHKVEPGRVLVEDARGQPPTIPFWLGEAPARTEELSLAVSRLRQEVAARALGGGELAHEVAGRAASASGLAGAIAWLRDEVGTGEAAATQLASYLAAAAAALGTMPSRTTLVAERFFDEAGDMHLVVHAPFGSRLNRAWGLALRKRFCQTFNFELQAAASEDAIILSLGPTHSFPLEDVFRFLNSASVRQVVTQAVLDSPLFPVRWRWAASRALAVPRWRAGRRVPAPRLRQDAEDLVAVVFPDQLACFENIAGEREVPDHPLVAEALRDCLEEAMDTAGLERLLGRLERGELTLQARDLTEPSPLAHEILAARPYAFLDDAPLEERRTQAVRVRRWLDPETASDLGALDAAAIARVRQEAWPEAETPDELHDALLTLSFVTVEEGRRAGWQPLFDHLAEAGRATLLMAPAPPAAAAAPAGATGAAGGRVALWVAAERLTMLAALHPGALLAPPIAPPMRHARTWPAEEAAVEVVRGRLQGVGPTTAGRLAAEAGLRRGAVEAALAALETEGFVLRGRFTPGGGGRTASARAEEEEIEWCERRLLARIHRYTLDRLRREIEPVSQTDFMRFLLSWHRVVGTAGGGATAAGAAGTTAVAGGAPIAGGSSAAGGGSALGGTLAFGGSSALGATAPPPRTETLAGAAGPGGGSGSSGEARGPQSLPTLLAQLEGFEAPAAAWEGEILPARLPGYDPLWLDALCLAGRYVWGRLTPAAGAGAPPLTPGAAQPVSPPGGGGPTGSPGGYGPTGIDAAAAGEPDRSPEERRRTRRPGPVRATPIAVLPRAGLPLWLQLAPAMPSPEPAPPSPEVPALELSSDAAAVYRHLVAGGASFFDELAAGARLLHTRVEAALGELVAAGLVTADSFTGLRALLVPAHKRPRVDRQARGGAGGGSIAAFGIQNAGRWSRLRPAAPPAAAGSAPPPARLGPGAAAVEQGAGSDGVSAAAVEVAAWALLRRYGVVFRRMVEREGLTPPWRDLLRVYRRLEARGEIRGGRFVDGFSGEQFALPEAVGRLRAVRREPRRGTLVSVSAADPLNLVGIVTPGERLPALAGNRVLFRDGEPIAIWEGRQARFLVDLGPAERWQAQNALTRRPMQSAAPRLRAYLGRPA
jgi:ATP-dependent Lhr-like helicase